MEMSLDELNTGRAATIVRVNGGGSVQRHMVDMGAVRGTPVEVVKVARPD